MAFTDIREVPKNSSSLTSDERKKVTGTVTRTFNLLSNAPTTDNALSAELALAFQGVTDTGEKITIDSRHPNNYFYTVNLLNTERNGQLIFTITVSYRSPIFSPTENPDADPEIEPPRIEFSSISSEEAVDEDIDGNALATATGEIYQGFTTEYDDLAATITKRFAIFNPASFYTYNNKVNSDSFLGFPPGVARCKILGVRPETFAEIQYWAVTVQVTFREPNPNSTPEKAWYRRYRHEGFYCFDINNPEKIIRCVDANGEPVSQPAALDENGYQITTDNPADEIWLEKQKYATIAFAGMNLGV